MVRFIFIFKENTKLNEWECLLSRCTTGTCKEPTTVLYDLTEGAFRRSTCDFVNSTSWKHARSYDEFMRLILDYTLTS